ncbi:MAG TPA: hypothetical protein DHW63_10930 [Hyphomonadaceae bacterium]|nr:hypothetical protein [Hyphomonadaceae bacterium]
MIAELSAIQAAAGSLKAAGEIVKTLVGMKVTAEVQGKIIELQAVILTAQSGAISAQETQMELLQRIRELEGDLVKFKDWEAEKKRYEAKRLSPGVIVYALKQESVQAGELAHIACPNCYDGGRKSILQTTPKLAQRYRVHLCPACGLELAFGEQMPLLPPPPPPRDPLG